MGCFWQVLSSVVWRHLHFPYSIQVFHDVAYKARSVEDLLAGIDEFMDQVTVLPPGN